MDSNHPEDDSDVFEQFYESFLDAVRRYWIIHFCQHQNQNQQHQNDNRRLHHHPNVSNSSTRPRPANRKLTRSFSLVIFRLRVRVLLEEWGLVRGRRRVWMNEGCRWLLRLLSARWVLGWAIHPTIQPPHHSHTHPHSHPSSSSTTIDSPAPPSLSDASDGPSDSQSQQFTSIRRS